MTKRRSRSATAPDSGGLVRSGPVDYDPDAVGRVAARVEIVSVELVDAHFSRHDSGPLPDDRDQDALPATGIAEVDWAVNPARDTLGATVLFVAVFEDEAQTQPYQVLATLRLVYALTESGAQLSDSDLTAFVHWNGVFNAWPYWREFLSSTLARAQLPQFVAPVMGVPRSIAGRQMGEPSE
jgi:hypothetical protein